MEAEKKTPTKKKRAPRGGNPLVDQITESIRVSPNLSTEDAVVEEARRNLGAVVSIEDAPEESRVPEDTVAPEKEPFNPFTRPQAVPPKPTGRVAREEGLAERLKTNQATPSTKRLGSLGKKLPGAERAKVHKRVESGQLAYIGEYTDGDLSQSQDIESFLNRYIKPSYGPGEYQITGVDAHGREFDMGVVNLLAPITPNAPTDMINQDTPLSLVKQLIDNSLRQQQQPTRGQERDPIRMLGELHELKKQMDPPPSEPKSNDLTLAIVGGLTSVGAALVQVLGQPKAQDPLMMALMAKLLDDDKSSRGSSGPMPPMPPPVDPTEQLKNLAAVVQSLQGGGGEKDDRLVTYLLQDRMTPADVLKLVNEVKGERGTDDFKKSMENIGIMLNGVNQLRAHTEPGTGAGFWDAIGSLVQNKELASTVASTIRGGIQGSQTPQQQQPQPPQRQALPDPLAIRARELAAKRMEVEERELALREQQLNAAGVPATTKPQLQVVQGGQSPTAEAPSGKKQPQLPDNIGDFINRFIEAKDDAEVIKITIEMLHSLGTTEDYKAYAEVIFNFIVQSDRGRFLNYMASFFVGLRTIHLIDNAVAERVMKSLADNFETIVSVVQSQMQDDAEGLDGDDDDDDDDDEEEDPDDILKLGTEEPLGEEDYEDEDGEG